MAKQKRESRMQDSCQCGSGLSFEQCCRPYLSGERYPVTAVALMCSRYTAYTLKDEAYLRRSWHPEACPDDLQLDDGGKWIGLKVLSTDLGGEKDETGEVEFVARYKIQGRAHRLHERSRFVRYEGRWVYLDGETKK